MWEACWRRSMIESMATKDRSGTQYQALRALIVALLVPLPLKEER